MDVLSGSLGAERTKSLEKTALLGAERTKSLEKTALLGAGPNPWRNSTFGCREDTIPEKTAIWVSANGTVQLQLQMRDGLIRLQLQIQLQCCNSPELITWL